jgi:hypothetical protein
MPVQKKHDVQEFAEKNYIENIRRQAKSSFSGSFSTLADEETTNETNEQFFDNLYWKAESNFSVQAAADILSDLD